MEAPSFQRPAVGEHHDLVREQFNVNRIEQSCHDAILNTGRNQLIGFELLLHDQAAPRLSQRLGFAIGKYRGADILAIDGTIGVHRGLEIGLAGRSRLQSRPEYTQVTVEHLDEGQEQNVFLVGNILVDRADADVGTPGDIADRGHVVTAFGEQVRSLL